MKRLLSLFLAVSMCLSPALTKRTDALRWKLLTERLEKGCEWDKKLKRPLAEQKRCIMLGRENLDGKIKKDFEWLRNSDELKELLQKMSDLTQQDFSNERIKHCLTHKGRAVSKEELYASLESLLDGLKNSEEAKNLTNYCKLNTERIRRKYSGAIEVPTNLTANDKKTRVSELINNKYLSDFVCEAFPLKVIENAVEIF